MGEERERERNIEPLLRRWLVIVGVVSTCVTADAKVAYVETTLRATLTYAKVAYPAFCADELFKMKKKGVTLLELVPAAAIS